MSTTETETITSPTTGSQVGDPTLDGDHERMAHIVLESYETKEGETVQAGPSVMEGYINGVAVQALCGKVWVPERNPKNYPVCQTCVEIAKNLGWDTDGLS